MDVSLIASLSCLLKSILQKYMHSSLENPFSPGKDNWMSMWSLKGKDEFGFFIAFLKSLPPWRWLQAEIDRDSSNLLPKGLSFRSQTWACLLCFWCLHFLGFSYWWYDFYIPQMRVIDLTRQQFKLPGEPKQVSQVRPKKHMVLLIFGNYFR